ncbi:hypothetical protein Pfo_011875 [Paulownia fortunei]|nr:hypothetical protein Pfo_011875 [Paulownia fortunei]
MDSDFLNYLMSVAIPKFKLNIRLNFKNQGFAKSLILKNPSHPNQCAADTTFSFWFSTRFDCRLAICTSVASPRTALKKGDRWIDHIDMDKQTPLF